MHRAHAEAAEKAEPCIFWVDPENSGFFILARTDGGQYVAIRLNDESSGGGMAGEPWDGCHETPAEATEGLVQAPSFTLKVERI